MGFAYLGIGVGGTLVPLLSARLVAALGWRGALQTLGILIIVLALPFAYFVREDPADSGERGAGGRAPGRKEPPAPVGAVFRAPAFYLLAIGSMCSIAAVGGTNQHLKLFLSLDLHYSQSAAASIISTVLAFSIAGRLFMGWLVGSRAEEARDADHLSADRAVDPPAVHGTLAGWRCTPLRRSSGWAWAANIMIIPLIAAELFGIKVLGRLLGVVLTADGVAEASCADGDRISARRDGQLSHRIRRPDRRCAGRSRGHSRAACAAGHAALVTASASAHPNCGCDSANIDIHDEHDAPGLPCRRWRRRRHVRTAIGAARSRLATRRSPGAATT